MKPQGNRRLFAWGLATGLVLGSVSVVFGPTVYKNLTALTTPRLVEGKTFYPRSPGYPVEWRIFYDSGNVIDPWIYVRKQTMADGTVQTTECDAATFQKQYPLDAGVAILPGNFRNVVSDFARPEYKIPIPRLAQLKLTLNCPDTPVEIIKARLDPDKTRLP